MAVTQSPVHLRTTIWLMIRSFIHLIQVEITWLLTKCLKVDDTAESVMNSNYMAEETSQSSATTIEDDTSFLISVLEQRSGMLIF
jgi:hypothetical protein